MNFVGTGAKQKNPRAKEKGEKAATKERGRTIAGKPF